MKRQSGFTLVELMVVVVIIAVLALVMGRAASIASRKALAVACAGNMRGIGAVVRLYAAEWGGNTSPNGGSFPALSGLPLRGEPGYVQADALELTDYVCPLDQNPFVLETGYRCSYQLASAFIGGNLISINSMKGTVMLCEMGKRHKTKGVATSIYLFADLHHELNAAAAGASGREGLMPGLRSRWYNKSSNLGVPASESRKELVWNEPLRRERRDRLSFLPGHYYDSSSGWECVSDWDRDAANEPRRLLGVWDGYLDLPRTGNWVIEFRCDSGDSCYLEVGGRTVQGRGTRMLTGPLDEGRTFVEFRFLETGDGMLNSYFQLYWRKTDAPTLARTLIPPERMSHAPFELSNVQN